MRTEEEIKNRKKARELELQDFNLIVDKFGWNIISDDIKRKVEEVTSEISILNWVLEYKIYINE